MVDLVSLLMWIVALIVETHLPFFLGPLLVFSFGGLIIALVYGHSSKRSNSLAAREARATAWKARAMCILGFVSLVIIYVVPFLLANTSNPYGFVFVAGVNALKENAANVWGNNLIWELAFCLAAVDLLRRATGVMRKKGPRWTKTILARIFWVLIAIALFVPVSIAMWKAAKSVFHW